MLRARLVGAPWSGEDAKLTVYMREDRHCYPLLAEIHDGYEITIVLKGEREFRWEDSGRMVGAGQVTLCPSWEPHG